MGLPTRRPRNQSQTSIEICCLPLTREGSIWLKTRDLSRRLSASSVAQHVVARTALTMRPTRRTIWPTAYPARLLNSLRALTDMRAHHLELEDSNPAKARR